MLHAGPSLLSASISLPVHVINFVRMITHKRLTPGPIFERVGVDYAGPFNINMDTQGSQPL